MILGTSKHAFSGPWSMYTEFSEFKQAKAIRHALTVRYIQNDLEIFDVGYTSPSTNEHLLVIVGEYSCPKTFHNPSPFVNTLPVVGLNVLSILNHEKLAIHVSVVRAIEKRLLSWEKRYDFGNEFDFGDTERHNFYVDGDHISVGVNRKQSDVAFDKVELDGKNKSLDEQHQMEPAFTYYDLYKRSLPMEDV